MSLHCDRESKKRPHSGAVAGWLSRFTPRTSRIPHATRSTPPACRAFVDVPVSTTVPTRTSTGASPRATIFLTTAAKAYAFLNGRGFVTPEDIKSIGPDVLRHRILVSYEAEAENMSSEDIIKTLFETIEVP